MNIWIVGAGSIGLLFAAKTAASGVADVRLVCRRNEQALRIAAEKLTWERAGQSLSTPLTAASWDDVFPDGSAQGIWNSAECDWIWLAVKQHQLNDEMLRRMACRTDPRTHVLCFQNGIGHREALSRFFPMHRIHLAVTTEAANKRNDARVAHTGAGITRIGTWPGEIPERASDLRASEELCEILERAGFRAATSNDMKSVVWNKLLINAAINPLSAVLRVPNGQLVQNAHTLRLMQALLQEGLAVANALGIRTAADLWDQLIDVCRKTSGNESSMLQDVKAGRRTEIDRMNGAIAEYAQRLGIEAASHSVMHALVKALEGR